jgi:hypothetical protein
MVKKGFVTDHLDQPWYQEKFYIKGLSKPNFYGNLGAGIWGAGMDDQIADIYRKCCQYADHPEDEIFFFGFSRGAFAVRAVAGLLHYMRAPKARVGTSEWNDVYKEALSIYKAVHQGDMSRQGAIDHYMSKTRNPPQVKFLGALDTVKAFDDNGLYDVSSVKSIQHCRQALALNEKRKDFQPSLWSVDRDSAEFILRTSPTHSLLQAWFIGTHSDLCGANIHDGLSLYPLQWVVSEAIKFDLVLGREIIVWYNFAGDEKSIDDPTTMIFPDRGQNDPAQELLGPFELELENGISVMMWDLQPIHAANACLEISLNDKYALGALFSKRSRTVFHKEKGQEGELVGYFGNGLFCLL